MKSRGSVVDTPKLTRSALSSGDSFDDPALDALEVWVASPENVIQNFVIASHIPASAFKPHSRVVNLPVSV